MRKTISVPEVANDLTVRQYLEFLKIDGDEEFKLLSALRIFYGISLEEGRGMHIGDVAELATIPLDLMNQEHELQRIVEYRGKEYGFVPNLMSMTFGEYVDLDTYLGDVNNLHKTLSVLYRPVVKRQGSVYEIADYTGSDDYSDFPLGAGIGALLFFYRLRSRYNGTSQTSLKNQKNRT